MAGRTPTVSADEVMLAIATHPEPVVTARDINDKLGLEPESALARLRSLEEDGYVNSKRAGASAVVWWMTDEGKSLLSEAQDL